MGFLGRGQRFLSPPARWSGDRCKLPSGVLAEPRKIKNLVQLENAKVTTEICYRGCWQVMSSNVRGRANRNIQKTLGTFPS